MSQYRSKTPAKWENSPAKIFLSMVQDFSCISIRLVLHDRYDTHSIIVGHGGIFTFTLKDICPEANHNMIWNSVTHNCSISRLDFAECMLTATLHTWADSRHLTGEAAQLISGIPESENDIVRPSSNAT